MRFNKALTVMAAISLVFGVAFAAEARHFGHGRWAGPDLDGLRTVLELKLTEAQQAGILNILKEYEAEKEKLRAGGKEARRNLAAVLRADRFNEEDVRKAFRQASAAKEQIFLLKAKTMAQLKALLTSEQLTYLKEQKAKRIQKAKHGFHARPGDKAK